MNLNSLKQTPTPLNSLYFSEFNMHLVQKGIRQKFRNDTNIRIDYQNPNDLYALMRVVFINNSGDHFSDVNEQVRAMNTIVIDEAIRQIKTGVAQYVNYIRDIETISEPMDRPLNTTTFGKKIDINNKIGIN
jgi:hypothetical protein